MRNHRSHVYPAPRTARLKQTAPRTKISFIPKRKLGIFFVVIGFFLLLSPKLIPRIEQYFVSSPNSAQPIKPDNAFSIAATGKPPVRIVIPTIGIDLAVTTSPIKNGYWILSDDTASFGEGSAPPGSNGNTVIFAHARQGLFLPLKDIKTHAQIYVMTDTQWFAYDVTEIKEVWPSDIYVVSPTKSKQLTLFTCDGFFDNKRLVVIGKPI